MESNKKQIVSELETEKKVLEEKLGHVNLALRAFKSEPSKAAHASVVTRKRVHITPEMRRKYSDEVIAVLEAYGPCTLHQLVDRGNFEEISRTSIYRLALAHERVRREDRGKTIIFSLN